MAPYAVRRVSLVGGPGSGKTTVGRRLAASLDAPYVELDGLFHQPGWTELPAGEFRRAVGDIVARDRWVVDGNYSTVRDLVWARADTVVWLDLPRPLVVRRVVARTLRRAMTRQVLWNGNREPLTNFYRLDPERNIIRWAWTMHPNYLARYEAAMADAAQAHLRFVRLRAPAEVSAFLAAPSG
ncbi:MAG TPA: shikimate kinase [Acidimicrobiia bacterium]|nr:shikimate kinase [Acidimicrobiia bacterium]